MNKLLTNFVRKHGRQLCALALAVAPMVSQGCAWKFYQPKEPEGFEDWLKEELRRRKNITKK